MTRKEAIDSQTQEELMVQKYTIEDLGVRDKTRVYADNAFVFSGELKKL